MVNAESFVILGQSLVTQGNLDKALDKFKIAIKLQSSNPAALKGIVDVLSRSERFSELEEFLALRLKSGDSSDFILMKLAVTRFNMQHPEEAIKLLDKCKHQAGHDWHVHKLKAHLALQQVESALPHGLELLVPILERINRNPEYRDLPLYAKIGKYVHNLIRYDLRYAYKLPSV